jgi:hypothetical protein
MRIPDADPGDQNHAEQCGHGSATLYRIHFFAFYFRNLMRDYFVTICEEKKVENTT